MNGTYLEQQTDLTQSATSPAPFMDEGARLDGGGSGRFFSAVTRVFCCLSMLLLLLIWPTSDWIGLLVLSQALFSAAYLLKSTSKVPSTEPSAARGTISLAQGEDHAH